MMQEDIQIQTKICKKDERGLITIKYEQQYQKYQIILTSNTKKIELDQSYLENKDDKIILEFVLEADIELNKPSIILNILQPFNLFNENRSIIKNNTAQCIKEIIVNISKLNRSIKGLESAIDLITTLTELCQKIKKFDRITVIDGENIFTSTGNSDDKTWSDFKEQTIDKLQTELKWIYNKCQFGLIHDKVGREQGGGLYEFIKFYKIPLSKLRELKLFNSPCIKDLKELDDIVEQDFSKFEIPNKIDILDLIIEIEQRNGTSPILSIITLSKALLKINIRSGIIKYIIQESQTTFDHKKFIKDMLYHIGLYFTGIKEEIISGYNEKHSDYKNKSLTIPQKFSIENLLTAVIARKPDDPSFFYQHPRSSMRGSWPWILR